MPAIKKPRSPTPRPPRTPPISSPRPSSQSTITPLPSPPSPPPRGRRQSPSIHMHWLSRSSTQSSSSAPYAPSKPTRISEQKMARAIEILSQRTGVLGSGATVVRTPDEALRETGVRLTFDGKAKDGEFTREINQKFDEFAQAASIEHLGSGDADLPSPPSSPSLPPLPLSENEHVEESPRCSASDRPKTPPRPTRAPPPVPPPPSLRPSLKVKSMSSAPNSDQSVPPLPSNISASPPPPSFKPILMSEAPTGIVDPSKIIVTLETCTATYRTTLDTIQSRPSYLSTYVASLCPRSRTPSITSSLYSNTSDDMSTYRQHLASQGLLPQSSFNIHIFLDRPSAPYTHILTYLRSPLGSPETPEVLPRASQLHSFSHSRLEALLELRDEAAYLNLDGLHKLCTDEIRLRHAPRLHHRGHSSSTTGSVHSLHASVYSLHTLLERVESDIRSSQRDSDSSDTKYSKDNPSEIGPIKSPPTPESWNGPPREKSRVRPSRSRSPHAPAGWI